MDIKEAYNKWADQYDTNMNKTRDLEAVALRENLSKITFKTCLEIGCGSGKNTEWLLTKANEIIAIDLSEEMLSIARKKIKSDSVIFIQADINQPWDFTNKRFDLIGFSLVLEHIENLDSIFRNASNLLSIGGQVYIGELHPFKQYTGSKARFDTEDGQQIVTCFNHNISDFIQSAQKYGFEIVSLNEYFDENNNEIIPRILTIMFKRTKEIIKCLSLD
ncbi:MAG TPA: class I SAM-dependent methyltransferase [Chitinophagaceae bacterium]